MNPELALLISEQRMDALNLAGTDAVDPEELCGIAMQSALTWVEMMRDDEPEQPTETEGSIWD